MPEWFDRWLDAQVARLGYTKAQAGPGIGALFGGEAQRHDLYGNLSGEEWDKLAMTCSWVYTSIDTVAGEAAQASLGVYRQAGEDLEAEQDHEFEQRLRQPNPHMGQFFFKKYLLLWLLLRGESYWWKVLDSSGKLVQLWPVPASRMEPIPDAQQYIRGFRYHPRQGGAPVVIPPDQVVYHRLPNLFNYHRGMSPISVYRQQLKTDRRAVDWNYDTFDKGSPLKMLISLPDHLTDQVFAAFVTDIKDQFTQGNRMLFGRGNDISAKEFGISPADMEFLAGREFTRDEIGMIYGIQPGFWSKDANRANAEAARATMIEKSVWPLLVQFAEDITAQVIRPLYGDDYLVMPEDIRPRDRMLEVAERRQYWQVKTVDEARAELGLEPVGDDRGQMLVPEVVRGGPLPPGPALPAGAASAAEKAMREDLRRWESIARRRLRDGEDPGSYEFTSDCIPDGVLARVKSLLTGAETNEQIAAAFAVGKELAADAAPFPLEAPGSWGDYP